jgi:tetratricopeptide (TPR) repeat protein
MEGSRFAKHRGAAQRWGRVLAVVALWFSPLLSPVNGSYGYNSPAARNPIGRGTVPPSSYESSLVNTPNPIDSTGNLPITGNVRGGKHFRGSVPYNSVTSFGASLGSTRLDSFLRYSAIPKELGESPRGYSTFYSPTGTVATIPPGRSNIFAPTSPKIAGSLTPFSAEQSADTKVPAEVPQSRVSATGRIAGIDTATETSQRLRLWPMSRTPAEMREVISDELGNQFVDRRTSGPDNEIMTPEEYRHQLEQLQRKLDRVKAGASDLEQTLEAEDGTMPPQEQVEAPIERLYREPQRRSVRDDLPRAMDRPQEPPHPTASHERSLTSPQTPDTPGLRELTPPATEGMVDGAQADAPAGSDLQRGHPQTGPGQFLVQPSHERDRIDAIFSPRTERTAEENESDEAGKLPALQRIEETSRAFDATAKFLEHPLQSSTGGDVASADRTVSATRSDAARVPDQLGAADGRGDDSPGGTEPDASELLIGDHFRRKYEDAGTFSDERFDRYLRAAELYLRQGRHYRAADSFTLASMYKPSDARAYVGKSHALLAAGEYVSSATFLAKAIQVDPRLTLAQTDLVETLGGPDPFVQRITDLEEAAAVRGAPQMHFLLAYIYYQMSQPEQAKAALAAAEKGLPASLSIDLMKAAIGG